MRKTYKITQNKLDTAEALRTAIANLWVIHEYDKENNTLKIKNCIHSLRQELLDLITITV